MVQNRSSQMVASTQRDIKSPHSIEAERALLGSIILDNDQLDSALKTVQTDDFYSEAHRIAFRVMLRMRQNGRAIDSVTIFAELTDDEANRVGGACYVASLTDGVPIGNFTATAEYSRIIKDHSLRRQAINTANNLLARSFEGVDDIHDLIDSLGRQAAELASRNGRGDAKVIEAEAKKEIKPNVKYPELPEEAWYGITKVYRSAVEHTSQASNNYHLASFYTAFGALIGRSAYNNMTGKIFPNLFMVFVGPQSEARKGTAIRYTQQLATEIDPNIFTSIQLDSKESFIREVGPVQQNSTDPEAQKSLRIILALEEFKELLEKAKQKGVRNIMPFVCKMYDCPEYIEVLTGEKAKCKQPFLVIDGATSPSYLESLSKEDIEGGLGSRIVTVGGHPKPREGFDEPPDKDSELYNAVKVRLADIVSELRERAAGGPVKIPLNEGARKLWKKWWLREFNPPCDDEIITTLSGRDHVTARKIALQNALLDLGPEVFNLEINEDHLYAALRFVNFLYEMRWPIFAGHGLTPMAQIDRRIVEYVKAQPRSRAMWKILRNRMQRACPDQKIYNERMRALTDGRDAPLRIESIGNIRFLVVND